VPDITPRRLVRLATGPVRRFASIDDWLMRRPWETIRAAMEAEFADASWVELSAGTAFLAAGSRGSHRVSA
jgi:demethylmenaquinone methyltransferase/2-methoxy-6-polyprenyl-1,4-benzoquinol methylase